MARFKFRADAGLAHHLAHLMQHAPHVEPALEAADQVMAMPLSAARLRERGFNQAFALAKQLSPQKASANILLRLGDGAHQVGASREERHALVQDVFWVAPKALPLLKNKRVVLVDDVMTTGATLYAAARVLRAAGVAHITGLVFARAEKF
jgi:ComF family protein